MCLNGRWKLNSPLRPLARALCSIALWLAQQYATLGLWRWL